MSNRPMIFVLTMLFSLSMIVRTKIIGHYSLFVTHYSLLEIQTPAKLHDVCKPALVFVEVILLVDILLYILPIFMK